LQGLPILIDDDLKKPLAAYRRFRHVVHHHYVMQLDWQRLVEGVREVETLYARFKAKLKAMFAL
jgi:uncharacterized protein YutE (UPF0331/DUF86 family)